MAEKTEKIVRRELRSPRAAAIAGILFSLMMIVSMVLTTSLTKANLTDISADQLKSWSKTASIVLGIVPYAGIAFLYFTGVVRDLMGDHEDRFFETIFLGSGIILVLLWFIWAATFGAIYATFALAADRLADNGIYLFGFTLMNQIMSTYSLRMAGVYMSSIGTLWNRTNVMPRWLIIITYLVGLAFLLFANWIREARFVFPGWILLVSTYILIMNFRRTHAKVNDEI